MPKTAILLGGSGAVGSELLQLLLADSRYEKIKLFARSSVNNINPKIEEHLINLFELSNYTDVFKGDEVYCCIGTTKAKTPDKKTYRDIDYGIPVAAAKLAAENNIGTYIVVSAIGADADSSIFYNRTKGEMQDAVLTEHISKVHLLQPSLILAQRKDNRIVEKLAEGFMWVINPLLFGGAAKYRSIKAATIAKAMLWLANNNYSKTIIQSDAIEDIGKKS
ncbi:MAG: nucleoside-diphosphate sugar epimerase [Flavobacterium psychrophilum]|nr:MAG: nucleoside-diphosphate sugar epimerase [Flavobacterium psychrophilum]